jgi:ketosteroid isomerase-like protein
MTNVELIKEGYVHFSTGNVPAVLATFDPAIQWHQCKSFPYVEGEGIYSGPDEVVKNIFMKIPEYYDGFTITITDIFGSGDKVAMQGFYEGVYKTTGKRFKANAAHIWTVKDGKATHFFQAVDTATIIN